MAHVQVRLGMVLVAGRDPVGRAATAVVGAGVERDVEMLGPEDDLRRLVADRRRRPRRVECRGGERVELCEPISRGAIEIERRLVGGHAVEEEPRADERGRVGDRDELGLALVAVLETTMSTPATRTWSTRSLVLERRRAEPAGRRHQRDLVVRLAGRGDDLLGDAVQRFASGGERLGQGREAHRRSRL